MNKQEITTNKYLECSIHRLDTSGFRCVDCGKIIIRKVRETK